MTVTPPSSGAAPRDRGAEPVRPGSGEMFDRIAGRYDLLNRVLSLGIDQRWRRRAVRALELGPGARVLDVATGTADLALTVAKGHPDCEVVGVDPSANMLDVGRDKIANRGWQSRIQLQQGVAESLPFDDDTFDGTLIAFGIRNVPDREAGLREMARVTRPTGRVAILELSEPPSGLLGWPARAYVHNVVPAIGGLLSRSSEYRYLQKSIQAFPSADRFVDMMLGSGFAQADAVALTFGVCHLFTGRPSSTQRGSGQPPRTVRPGA